MSLDNNNLNTKENLILDVCCAPCLSGVYPQIKNKYKKIVMVYQNDNICCQQEFDLRLTNFFKYLRIYNINTYEVIKYNHNKWLNYIKGLENEKEGGSRCLKCFKYRFLNLKKIAEKYNIYVYTTTLTISPYKNYKLILKIANEVEKETGLKYIPYNFKKRDWYKKSIKISKALNLYRQKFCGCEFSIKSKLLY